MTSANAMAAGLDGSYALITGGTQGLGEATARLFAARGAAGLIISGRNAQRGHAVARSIAAEHGCAVHFVQSDLADLDQCGTLIEAADHHFGTLTNLVNCAALTDRGTIIDTDPALFDRMMAVNLRAPFFLMQGAARLMLKTGTKGAMVNILSMSSHGGQPFITAYCASKGGLATLTRNVGFSLARNGIRVNGLNIGWMDTPGEDHIQRTYHGAEDGWKEHAERDRPAGRLLKPDEVARAIAFLSSPESGLMTGSIVDFDQSVLGCYEAPPEPDRRSWPL